MQQFIDQANHNIDFHGCIDTNFENRFTDWKITVLFYIAIHMIKALAEKDKKRIGNSHQEINRNINPENPNAEMKISRKAWRSYQFLFKSTTGTKSKDFLFFFNNHSQYFVYTLNIYFNFALYNNAFLR